MNTVDRTLVVEKLAQLNLNLSPEINYRLETMFPKLDGIFADSKIKTKFKLVLRVEPLLKKMLFENETVLYVFLGKSSFCSPGKIMGRRFAQIDIHVVVILTKVRLLCIRTNGKGVPKKMFWSMYYSQIKTIKKKIGGWIHIDLEDGSLLFFVGFSKVDEQTLQEVYFESCKLFEKNSFNPKVSQSQENLCGNCLEVVPKNNYECKSCGATFWKPSQIAIRAFLIPCWGYFVMKNYFRAFHSFLMMMAPPLFVGIAIQRNFGTAAEMGIVLIFLVYFGSLAMMSATIVSKGLHLRKIPKS